MNYFLFFLEKIFSLSFPSLPTPFSFHLLNKDPVRNDGQPSRGNETKMTK